MATGLGWLVPGSAGADGLQPLVAAYPDHIARIDGGAVWFRDGGSLDVGAAGGKSHADWLERPSIADILLQPYPRGPLRAPPAVDSDPGRARPEAFFTRIYGDCRKGEVGGRLVDVVWLPGKSGQRLRVTRTNGVAERLAAVSAALDQLPARFDAFLKPSAGAYNCRAIAGTGRISAHGYGIAVDIATAGADYWRWHAPGAAEPAQGLRHRNRVPYEIVEVFEAHGFIWGGKWHHYDTMHFEYRPELLAPTLPLHPQGRP